MFFISRTTLEEHRDGFLYIVLAAREREKPVINRYWFPLDLGAGVFKRNHNATAIGQQVINGRYPGQYTGVYDKMEYSLAQGGKTEAKYTTSEIIPEPKQRGSRRAVVKYTNYRWYKHTKKRGWVAIE